MKYIDVFKNEYYVIGFKNIPSYLKDMHGKKFYVDDLYDEKHKSSLVKALKATIAIIRYNLRNPVSTWYIPKICRKYYVFDNRDDEILSYQGRALDIFINLHFINILNDYFRRENDYERSINQI